MRKAVRCHQRNRFFTPCHCLVYQVSHKAFLPLFRMTADSKASSGSECEGSAVVVRKAVRCHQRNRFFTLSHCLVYQISHTAFLSPLRMTADSKASSGSECEGSAPVMRQAFFQEGIVDFQKPESGLRRLKTSWQQKRVPDV